MSHQNSDSFGDPGNTLFSIGCGEYNDHKEEDDYRKNAVEVFQDGHTDFLKQVTILSGGLKIGNTVLSEGKLKQLLKLLEVFDLGGAVVDSAIVGEAVVE